MYEARRREQLPPSFEDIRLSSIVMDRKDRVEPEAGRIGYTEEFGSVLVNIQGTPFEVRACRKTYDTAKSLLDPLVEHSYSLYEPDQRDRPSTQYILGTITLKKSSKNRLEATTIIEKMEDHDALRGIGLKLWKKLLGVIQDTARSSPQSITHVVTMNPEISSRDTPLSPERWLEIFGPTLKQGRYTQTDDRTWSREYSAAPAKSRPRPSAAAQSAA